MPSNTERCAAGELERALNLAEQLDWLELVECIREIRSGEKTAIARLAIKQAIRCAR